MEPPDRLDLERLVWQPGYELGFPMIDTEHRYLVDLVRRAVSALGRHDPAETLTLIGRFVAACQYHFTHEEEVMREISFEGVADHIQYHRKLLRLAEQLLEQCESAGGLESLGGHLVTLASCLLDDVVAGDRELLPYLREKGLSR